MEDLLENEENSIKKCKYKIRLVARGSGGKREGFVLLCGFNFIHYNYKIKQDLPAVSSSLISN